METWLQMVLTALVTVLASSGFWTYMQAKERAKADRDVEKAATTRLLMGMAYDQITTLGIAYINRGWITKDELEELEKYFYEPYKELGGNGVAERIMKRVTNLQIRSHSRYPSIFQNQDEGSWVNNVRVITPEDQGTPAG